MVSSQTGSGKTAAFLLPVLHLIEQRCCRGSGARRLGSSGRRAPAAGQPAPNPSARTRCWRVTSLRPCRAPSCCADARTCAAGRARRDRPGQALPRPACRQRGGRHPYPVQIAKLQNADLVSRPGPPARPAAQRPDQARQGAVPGRRRGRPHARPGFSDDLAEINQPPSSATRP